MDEVKSPSSREDDCVNPSYVTDDVYPPFQLLKSPPYRMEHDNDVDVNDNDKVPHTGLEPRDRAGTYPDPLDHMTSDTAGLYSADVRAYELSARYHDIDISLSDDDEGGGDVRRRDEPAVLDVSVQDEVNARRGSLGLGPSAVGLRLGPAVLEQPARSGRDPDVAKETAIQGLDNEAYDGDEETVTDHSFHDSSFHANDGPFVISVPDPSAPDRHGRPSSGRYHKNPALERKRPPSLMTQGPYDPNNRVFLSPLPLKGPAPPEDAPQKARRIPRPPSKLKLKCAFIWSCFACLVGNFLCAIPALRYFVTAKESSKIGDYNSAHSYLKKAAILAAVAIALAAAGWTILILYLTHAAFR